MRHLTELSRQLANLEEGERERERERTSVVVHIHACIIMKYMYM